MTDFLWIGLGGFVGANARYFLGGWIMARLGSAFPYATFVINITGSLILGLLMGIHEGTPLPSAIRLGFAVGFVGAYTTFSTFSYETMVLIENGSLVAATLNSVGSVVVGLLAVVSGLAVGRALW